MKNWTEPVGGPTRGSAATVAVKVTGWPKVEGFGEATTVVAVPALWTVTSRTWEVLPGGKKRPVHARFKKIGNSRYGFEAPGRSPQRRLVIDPGLEWATFYGGHEREEISAVALTNDGSGDVVVVGRTFSADVPRTSGALTGVTDSYVARFSSDGSTLRYASIFGGMQLYSDAYDVALEVPPSDTSRRYLKTKKEKLGHILRSV